jgi:hypothetical protein
LSSNLARVVRYGGVATLLSTAAALVPPTSGAASALSLGQGAAGNGTRGIEQGTTEYGYAPPGMRNLATSTSGCPRVGHRQASRDENYRDPLAHARVSPERIDQGVDYSGTGTLTSIGSARITYVGRKNTNTGWPGAFIEYRLLGGNFAGRYVYYAEGVRPATGIRAGRRVRQGVAVVHLIRGWSTGIEIGWGANIGTETLARELGEYRYPTRCGQSFSNFVQSLGGPPGKR